MRKGIPVDWLEEMAQMQRSLDNRWLVYRRATTWEPPTDVYENEQGLVVLVEIAGMEETDFHILLDERRLVVTGVRQDPELKRAYYQMEIRYGEFRSEVYLPWPAEPGRVEATYENGLLRIFVPRPTTYRVPVVGQE